MGSCRCRLRKSLMTALNVPLDQLRLQDLILLGGREAMVIAITMGHPQVKFLDDGCCCSLVAPVHRISERSRIDIEIEFSEGYAAALAAVVY